MSGFTERLMLGYVIDVCATCGRHAIYPFCEHRSETGRWTVPIAVKATHPMNAVRDAANTRSKLVRDG